LPITYYLKIAFGLIFFGLVATSFYLTQPNVGLENALSGGLWSLIDMQLIMTAAVYCLLLAPGIFIGTRPAFGFSALLICLVAFGPRLAAEYTIMQQRAKVQENDQPAVAFKGAIQVIDFYGLPCRALCRPLLENADLDAVRTINEFGIVEVFTLDNDGTRDLVYPVEDVFAPGDLTVAIDRADPSELRGDWDIVASGFARPEFGSRFTITRGGAGKRANAPALFRETELSHSIPVIPTQFQPVMSGWTSGGNRGGVGMVRFKRWNEGSAKTDILATLSSVGLDVPPGASPAD
jgi:hypothetical protein